MIQDMCILIRTFAIPTTFHIFALVEGWILYCVVYFLHNFEWRTWNLSLISKCTCNSTVKVIFFWLHNYSAQLLLTVHCSWKVNFYFLFHSAQLLLTVHYSWKGKFLFFISRSRCFCLSPHYLSLSLHTTFGCGCVHTTSLSGPMNPKNRCTSMHLSHPANVHSAFDIFICWMSCFNYLLSFVLKCLGLTLVAMVSYGSRRCI